jgi:hypothetical protein
MAHIEQQQVAILMERLPELLGRVHIQLGGG